MSKIKVLDCTLRDGGYLNNWIFGTNNIQNIISKLALANIDYIECGFLNSTKILDGQAFFNSPEELIPEINNNPNLLLMINFGEISIDKIPNNNNKNTGLRVAFKKEEQNEAIKFCKQLKEKNYNVFINPKQTIDYSDEELDSLINLANTTSIDVFTIVDTNGSMQENDVIKIFKILDSKLNPEINIGFHSHNNLDLSLKNSSILAEQKTMRTLIIDSTIGGIGRGAGNLATEDIIKYLNTFNKTSYNLNLIQELATDKILTLVPHFSTTHKQAYKISAQKHCHPNYATFLIEKAIPSNIMENILQKIPHEFKSNYNKILIQNVVKEVTK